ncbi:M20 aminoacylase family protein [Microvirga alba]|uniref:Amidohydrolase n=1 Tax=Microvirga alba TaxID=2791025 RepID=A0A931BYU7_9HYPH|nr:M20 aminoacylase family protein [Microvirga alba]MBF9235322.1 amidohydrolase [Microvirga alba]
MLGEPIPIEGVDELIALRRDLHAHPELAFAEHRTSAIVACELAALGIEVHRHVGGTGVVGLLRAGSSDRRIGLRADMDALPMSEATDLPYASRYSGMFHGCGHDGHTTMLIGAARLLAATRRFDGTVVFIFQPAEEGRAGAKAMIDDGLFERFGCDRIFALHNWPQLPVGTLGTRTGPIMAAADRFEIALSGRGGHAALPHLADDVLLAASRIVLSLNTIVSRRLDAAAQAVLSVTRVEGGTSHNVLPATARIGGTARSFDPAVRDVLETTLRAIVAAQCAEGSLSADITYDRYYPATRNDAGAARAALAAGRDCGINAIEADSPSFASEDFAFMLEACPGAYVWLGQGRGADEPPLHHPRYDFNDDVIPLGVAWFAALAERELAA